MNRIHRELLTGAMIAVAGWGMAAQTAEWRPRERWRGFNLPGLVVVGGFEGRIYEKDFEMIHDLGFNFVRLPIDYRYFCSKTDEMVPDPSRFGHLDEIVAWGKRHKVHINLAYATFPGMQLKPRSKKPLFTDPKVRGYLAENWRFLAKRYRGIPNDELTFNLFNEPDGTATEEDYVKIVRLCLEAIHAEDPTRFVFIDGLRWGRKPVMSLVGTPLLGQSNHSYEPHGLTHYRPADAGKPPKPIPAWPDKSAPTGEDYLKQTTWNHWEPLLKSGTFVMVGEFGVMNIVPHDITLAWMEDNLKMWKERGLGWAMWNFRGVMGIMDSKRADVKYVDYRGHKLDQQMYELLKRY